MEQHAAASTERLAPHKRATKIHSHTTFLGTVNEKKQPEPKHNYRAGGIQDPKESTLDKQEDCLRFSRQIEPGDLYKNF